MTFLLSLLIASGTLSQAGLAPTGAVSAAVPAVDELLCATPLAWDDEPARPCPRASLDRVPAEPATEQQEDDEEPGGLPTGTRPVHPVWPHALRYHVHARHVATRSSSLSVCLRC